MSHSCTPNCNTALMISDNEYKIGMYATKDIEIG
jgi:SET domain-containing protein